MGNCIERASFRVEQQQGGGERQENREENRGISFGANKDEDDQYVKVVEKNTNSNSNAKSGVRVKMVLTKEELQWLMMKLSNRDVRGGGGGGTKRIEDVLEEIEKGRRKLAQGWKPSLDSISEIPEVLEMHR